MAKSALTVQSDITVAVREIDFVTRFGKNWDSLREILGIMRPIRKTPGTKLASYKASMKSVALQGGATCMFWDGTNNMCGDDYCSRAERKEHETD